MESGLPQPDTMVQQDCGTFRQAADRIHGQQFGRVSASFSLDGERITTAGYDGTARLWISCGKQTAGIQGPSGFNSVRFQPGWRLLQLETMVYSKTVGPSGSTGTEFADHHDSVNSVSFSPGWRAWLLLVLETTVL